MEQADRGHVKKNTLSKVVALLLVGFAAGVMALIGVRFATYRDDSVHYHANFALYINGQRDELKNFTFYEEVNICSSDELDNPKTRVHLHEQNASLVHVHAHAVTWGQLFDNLGYTLGNNLVKTDKGVYVDDQDGKQLTFMLNGEPVQTAANRVIKSEDVLLINYGQDDDKTLKTRYDAIPRDAAKANTQKDPNACSGGTEATPKARLLNAIGLKSGHH